MNIIANQVKESVSKCTPSFEQALLTIKEGLGYLSFGKVANEDNGSKLQELNSMRGMGV